MPASTCTSPCLTSSGVDPSENTNSCRARHVVDASCALEAKSNLGRELRFQGPRHQGMLSKKVQRTTGDPFCTTELGQQCWLLFVSVLLAPKAKQPAQLSMLYRVVNISATGRLSTKALARRRMPERVLTSLPSAAAHQNMDNQLAASGNVKHIRKATTSMPWGELAGSHAAMAFALPVDTRQSQSDRL